MLNLTIAMLLAASTAQAQPEAQPNSQPEIIVEGTRDQRKAIDRFVGALTDAPVNGQLSRFDWAVCPAAVGLTDAQNAAIVERMRKVAAAVGMKTAAANCTPNALVIVTRDKRDLIEQLEKKWPDYFTGLSDRQIKALREEKGPAAWHVEGKLNRDGREIGRDQNGGHYINEMTDTPSRLSPASRPHFLSSILVADVQSLDGLTITQFADYAAMRTFARTDPDRLKGSSASTILTMFDKPEGTPLPVTLTQWDFDFLKGLYSVDPNHYASTQRGSISRSMRDSLGGPDNSY